MHKRPAIYLDVCALGRPFDDQSFLRIRLETEAVNLILSQVRDNKYRLLISPVHHKEIDANDEVIERIEIQSLLRDAGEPIKINTTKARQRAEELVALGFGIADAAHASYAEAADASLITCDDKFLGQCARHGISIWCGSPVAFCEKEGLK